VTGEYPEPILVVRAKGPATEGGRIKSITVSDIEPGGIQGEQIEAISAEEFWEEKSLEQMAAEQGEEPLSALEDVLGKGADLWEDDEDFAAFLTAVAGGKAEEPQP